MFDRAGQVNARFAGGSLQAEEVTQALLALGLEERQITVVKRADPGGWRPPEQEAGVLLRLLRRFGGAQEAAVAPTPDALVMVYLSRESGLAEQVQGVLQRFGATRVDYYPAGQVATSKLDGAGQGDDDAQFRAAFPDGEQRHHAPSPAVRRGDADRPTVAADAAGDDGAMPSHAAALRDGRPGTEPQREGV